MCLLDFGGGHELAQEELQVCLATASAAVLYLSNELEATLDRADEVAREDALEQLQQAEQEKAHLAVCSRTIQGFPFIHLHDDPGENGSIEWETSKNDTNWTRSAIAEAEELYRIQALDYKAGHQAMSLREESVDTDKKTQNTGRSLFATMVKAATSDKRKSES